MAALALGFLVSSLERSRTYNILYVIIRSRILSNTVRNVRKRERYQEKKLVHRAQDALRQNSPSADTLLTEALATRTGARYWPNLAQAVRRVDEDRNVVSALKTTLTQLGGEKQSQFRAPIIGRLLSNCTQKLSARYVRAQLGITSSIARKARQRQKHEQFDNILDSSCSVAGRGPRLHQMMCDIIVDFFHEQTHVASGAKRSLTRKLTIELHELHARFYASLPGLLRQRAKQCPPRSKQGIPLTKLQKDVQAALLAARQPNFDEVKEFLQRKQHADQTYLDKLARTRLVRAGVRVQKRKVGAKTHRTTEFDPSKWEICACTPETFFAVLAERKIKYTVVEHDTRCPIHDKGPVQERQLDIVLSALADLEKEIRLSGDNISGDQLARRKDLVGQKRLLEPAVRLYHIHLKQYATQRKLVQNIDANLTFGSGVLYRDYVNDHDEFGNKVCNLCLVLRTPVGPGEPPSTINIHNFANNESCDAYWTADVFDFHLAPGDDHHSGLLDSVHTLFIVGDHGPHFSANETVYNESCFFRRYGKKVRSSIFLYARIMRITGATVQELCRRDCRVWDREMALL